MQSLLWPEATADIIIIIKVWNNLLLFILDSLVADVEKVSQFTFTEIALL